MLINPMIFQAMMKTAHLIYLHVTRQNPSNLAESNDDVDDDGNPEERTGLLRSEDVSVQA